MMLGGVIIGRMMRGKLAATAAALMIVVTVPVVAHAGENTARHKQPPAEFGRMIMGNGQTLYSYLMTVEYVHLFRKDGWACWPLGRDHFWRCDNIHPWTGTVKQP